ncbi:LytR/AlgR family response regulator transcription factor [Aquabacterium sp.]|uniref:LytR/AlgR family response regulator transcription factor n=1 Tax=Aquabacterium sp. TaxID=1872578 RepID=UPI003784F7D7
MHATALIADDEPHLAHALQAQLATLWPGLRIVHSARNGVEAAERIGALQPDIAFLDIQMPGLSGLEVAEGIEGRTRVVFVTAYDQYAIEAFEQAALDYVLKPVGSERLARTVQRLQQALAQGTDEGEGLATTLRRLGPEAPATTAPLRWIRASQGDLVHQIDVGQVLFFRAEDKYTLVRTATAEHLIRTPIQELAQQLDGERFWQVHRSTVINVERLASARRDDASRLWLRLQGWDGELPVSRAYVHRFKAM